MIWFFSRGSFKSPNHQWLEIPWFLPIPSMYGTVYLPIWLFFNVLNMVFHVGKIYHSSHGMQSKGPDLGDGPDPKIWWVFLSRHPRLVDFPRRSTWRSSKRWRTVLHSTIWRRQAPSQQWPVRPGPWRGSVPGWRSVFSGRFWRLKCFGFMRRSHSGGRKGEKEKMFS